LNKNLFKEISDYFSKDLCLMENEMKSLFSTNSNKGIMSPLSLNSNFQDEILNFLFAPSKRLRPLSVFLIKDLFKFDEDKNIIRLAAAVELLHSATLVHDDIIDEASKRRRNETFNFKYNPKIAVILGDYLLSLSLKILSKIGSCEIFSYFSDNTIKLCLGEINQFFNKGKVLEEKEYIEKSKDKTSSLFIAGAKSALYLINQKISLSKDVQKAVLEFIENFSLGFQIYDDIENFKAEFDKNSNSITDAQADKTSSDIKNGVYTLPYLYLSQQNLLYDMMEADKESKIYKEALQYSTNYLNEVLKRAQNSIEPFKDIYDINLCIKLCEVFK